MDIGLALILCFLTVSMTAVKSQILEGPVNALKKVGDNVTLKCFTVNKNCDKVDWQKVEGLQSPKLVYRDGQGMLNNDVYPPQRFSVNEHGGCNLTITQLEIGDSGRFLCMQAVGEREVTRTSILIVINVTESCVSNVTSNALNKDDGYSLWCAINIPAKSVEPWNVTLSFHNKNESETETTDENQPLTVKTTLTGRAQKENITQRWCRASLSPNTQANYDNRTAILDICNTTELIVPPDPPSTFKPSDGDSQKVKGDAGNKCTCTGYIASIVISIIAVIISVIVVVFIVWKVESCPGHVCLHSMFECGCRSDCMGDAVCCACTDWGTIGCLHSINKNDKNGGKTKVLSTDETAASLTEKN